MAKLPLTQDLTHRITLCTSQDVAISGASISIVRQGVRETWAAVAESRQSLFSRDGVAIKESRDSASHKITIRYNPDLPISSAAWVYEARRTSEPRWYKVLAVSDLDERGRFSVLRCRLVQKSDDIAAPGVVLTPIPATGAFSAQTQVVR